MDAIWGHVMWSKPGSETQRSHVFFHMWKIEPKDKHIHKTKHDYIQTYMKNMFIIVGLLYGTWGRKERKREWQSTTLKYICADRGYSNMFWKCWTVGGGKEGVKESNGRGWINQSKVCSQRRYIEKPLWTLTLELIMKDMTVRSVHRHGGEGEQRRDEGEEIWLMCFTHIYKIELWNFL
jgi:hypothetical protein